MEINYRNYETCQLGSPRLIHEMAVIKATKVYGARWQGKNESGRRKEDWIIGEISCIEIESSN